MRNLILVLFGFILVSSCLGQSAFFSANDLNISDFNSEFSSFVSSLKVTKSNDQKLVKSLFNKAHKDFLRTYQAYSQVNDVFEKGNFDCLSGTYFLAASLDQLGLAYKIYETNYHIFLIVQTTRGNVLLESTDPYHGLVANQKAIDEKIAQYTQTKVGTSSQLYLSQLRMFHELLPSQLPGLLYFNRAVEAFNKNDLISCCSYLEQAWKIYDNPRIEAFTPILIHSIESSQLESSSKEKLTSLLRAHQQSSFHSLASR